MMQKVSQLCLGGNSCDRVSRHVSLATSRAFLHVLCLTDSPFDAVKSLTAMRADEGLVVFSGSLLCHGNYDFSARKYQADF